MRTFGLLLVLAGLHLVVAAACAIALLTDLAPINAEHPALKPLKFAVSIAVLLASVALVLRALHVSSVVRDGIAVTLAITLVVEMVAIAGQAARGRSSHYNTGTPFDAFVWTVMGTAIVVALVALVVLAALTLTHAFAFSPLVTFAIRAGLCLLLLVAISGFVMAGGHHRDLRAAHFFALHGLQVLPLVAIVMLYVPIGERARWGVVILATLLWTGAAMITLGVSLARHADHDPAHHPYAQETRQERE
ncbi:MAG: hypothetical protein ACKV2T_37670 [Kofleriaceae bacterium]